LLSENSLNSDDVYIENMKQKKRVLIISRIKKLEAFNEFNQKLISIFEKELEDIH
jgi:hypothetical protein